MLHFSGKILYESPNPDKNSHSRAKQARKNGRLYSKMMPTHQGREHSRQIKVGHSVPLLSTQKPVIADAGGWLDTVERITGGHQPKKVGMTLAIQETPTLFGSRFHTR